MKLYFLFFHIWWMQKVGSERLIASLGVHQCCQSWHKNLLCKVPMTCPCVSLLKIRTWFSVRTHRKVSKQPRQTKSHTAEKRGWYFDNIQESTASFVILQLLCSQVHHIGLSTYFISAFQPPLPFLSRPSIFLVALTALWPHFMTFLCGYVHHCFSNSCWPQDSLRISP